jgi:hypothetical protein
MNTSATLGPVVLQSPNRTAHGALVHSEVPRNLRYRVAF